MNIENLQSLYVNNINRLFVQSNFMEIASHSNDIQGYSFINRFLIYIQNKYCTNVKSEMSWQLDNRVVNDGAIPMGIITPILHTKYIDVSSKKDINSNELSPEEFNKAIALGIIEKETSIIDIKCTLVYDIRDTQGINNDTNNINTRKIKLSTILELLQSLGVNVVKKDINETTYDNSTNTIIIGEDELSNKVSVCIDTLTIKYIEQTKKGIDLSESEIKLIRDYAIYAVCTYFNIKSNIDFSYMQGLEYVYMNDKLDKLIEALDNIEYILNTNIFNAEDDLGYTIDEEHKTYIAHKATILLNILEANYKSNELKGV